ncbi:MAG: Mrp/NBP35 family ATP-binding protein [Phycisphaerales bacterium JB037]
MTLSKDQIRQTLGSVTLDLPGSPAAADLIEWVATCEGAVSLKLFHESLGAADACRPVADACAGAVRQLAGQSGEPLSMLTIEFVDKLGAKVHEQVFRAPGSGSSASSSQAGAPAQPRESQPQPSSGHEPIGGLKKPVREPGSAIPGVTHTIAVGAGKGGVGKSTVAVNLAVALARQGHAVGLMDGDIYGPSLPTMLGLSTMEQQVHSGMLQPHLVHGIKAITIGKLVDPEKPLIWRGPMAHGAFKQLAEQTAWGELDYLVIDLPPGTGDVPLTMAQILQLTGAVVVCTPQRVAQDDAVRAARMFQQLNIEVLGVVENMSYFIGDDGKEYDIFGRGGAEQMAQRMGLPFLGNLPINTALRANSDKGDPSANFAPDTAGGETLPKALETLADNLQSQVTLAAMKSGQRKPSLKIS